MGNKALIDMFKNTYCFYRQKYVIMDSQYTKTVAHYFTDKVIESHIDGKYALCVFAGPKVTRFISVDVDEGGKKVVRQVVDTFVKFGIPMDRIYVSTSGRKGYHVDIFFSPWLYNEKAKNLYDLMIWQTGLNPKKVEFRPTPWQAIKVPLGVHAKTGNRCWFLDQQTLKPIERMDYIAEIKPVEDTAVHNILQVWNKKRWNELYAEMICEDTGRDTSLIKDIEFNSEYFESKSISQTGTRHQVMLEIARDMRHFGANAFQIKKALRGFYYRQDPMVMESSEKEVMDDIEEIADWVEGSIPIWKYRKSSNDSKPIRIVFTSRDADTILIAPTSAARRSALLLYAYCKMFGSAHLSYATIADTIGCSERTTNTAINSLIKHHVINRQSGGCHYANGRLVRKSNTYFIPADRTQVDAGKSFEICEKITKENFSSYYYRILGELCSKDELAKYLTSPEMKECEKYGAESTDIRARWDADISGIQ